MRYWIILIVCLLAVAAPAQKRRLLLPLIATRAPMVVDYYVNLTNGTSGTLMTLAKATNGTWPIQGNSWGSFNRGTNLAVGFASNFLHSPVTIGSTTFDTSFAANCLNVTNNASFCYLESKVFTGATNLTLAGFFYPDEPYSFGYLHDVSVLNLNGGGCFLQFLNGAVATTNYALRVESGSGGHSVQIPLTKSTWYWFSFQVKFPANACQLDIFTITDWSLVQSVTYNIGGAQPLGGIYVRLGNAEQGDVNAPSGINMFQHVLIAVDGNAIAPLGP